MSMQDVVHDLLLEHGYDSPKDRVVDIVCYIIPLRIRELADELGWGSEVVKESTFEWMQKHVQKGD